VPPEQSWRVSRDLVDYHAALDIVKDSGTTHYTDIALDVGRRAVERYDWTADDFTSPRGHSAWTMRFSRGDWDTRTETTTTL
ncbi:peptidase S15, partial [Streptomyces sp. SID11233]|nr:peptidase S15 [Streptomyces sp. SID11233]